MASDTVDADPFRNRYATVDLADGQAVIYDRENGDAWVQSDLHIDRTECV